MSQFSFFNQPCESKWESEIYQLETTDLALGYNPATNQDGPANIQWLQLGNRTLFLRDFLRVAHTPEGHHALVNNDFDELSKILEQSLALDYSTKELDTMIGSLLAYFAVTRDRADLVLGNNVTMYEAIKMLLPYVVEYSKAYGWFEFFSQAPFFETMYTHKIIKEIAGDDSLDVDTTEGLEEGRQYVLCDTNGKNAEVVEIMSVLTDTRVRFTTDLQVTRENGVISRSNIVPIDTGGKVTCDCVYTSGKITVLKNGVSGKIYVCRDNVSINCTLKYQIDGETDWVIAPRTNTVSYSDGTINDVFEVPTKDLRFRLEYKTNNKNVYPFMIYYIVAQPSMAQIWVEPIRRPKITGAVYDNNNIKLTTEGYESLYDIEQNTIFVQVSTNDKFLTNVTEKEIFDVLDNEIDVEYQREGTDKLYIRLRYMDMESTLSRWSNVIEVD